MDDLNWMALQLFQPYFYYPLVLSLALFIAVNLAVRFTQDKGPPTQVVYVRLAVAISDHRLHDVSAPTGDPIMSWKAPKVFPFPANPMAFIPLHFGPPSMLELFSVTGTICISGLILGLSLLALCLVLNRYGTRRGLVPISEEDYPGAISIVAKRCRRFQVEQSAYRPSWRT